MARGKKNPTAELLEAPNDLVDKYYGLYGNDLGMTREEMEELYDIKYTLDSPEASLTPRARKNLERELGNKIEKYGERAYEKTSGQYSERDGAHKGLASNVLRDSLNNFSRDVENRAPERAPEDGSRAAERIARQEELTTKAENIAYYVEIRTGATIDIGRIETIINAQELIDSARPGEATDVENILGNDLANIERTHGTEVARALQRGVQLELHGGPNAIEKALDNPASDIDLSREDPGAGRSGPDYAAINAARAAEMARLSEVANAVTTKVAKKFPNTSPNLIYDYALAATEAKLSLNPDGTIINTEKNLAFEHLREEGTSNGHGKNNGYDYANAVTNEIEGLIDVTALEVAKSKKRAAAQTPGYAPAASSTSGATGSVGQQPPPPHTASAREAGAQVNGYALASHTTTPTNDWPSRRAAEDTQANPVQYVKAAVKVPTNLVLPDGENFQRQPGNPNNFSLTNVHMMTAFASITDEKGNPLYIDSLGKYGIDGRRGPAMENTIKAYKQAKGITSDDPAVLVAKLNEDLEKERGKPNVLRVDGPQPNTLNTLEESIKLAKQGKTAIPLAEVPEKPTAAPASPVAPALLSEGEFKSLHTMLADLKENKNACMVPDTPLSIASVVATQNTAPTLQRGNTADVSAPVAGVKLQLPPGQDLV